MRRSTRPPAHGSREWQAAESPGPLTRCSRTWTATSSSAFRRVAATRTASGRSQSARSPPRSPRRRSGTHWASVRVRRHRPVFMPGTYKTEAIVLRSIRYGEADRVLHLYSATRGRLGAIAKGSRRPRSRFGGRLEPFFRLDLVLHQGRGQLATVTSAATVEGYPRLRSSGAGIGAAARACDAVLRLLDAAEPNAAG